LLGLIFRKAEAAISWYIYKQKKEKSMATIIDVLRREHRNIENLLVILERELSVFDRGERPSYEVIQAVISYFEVYPDTYHHRQRTSF
jgi:hemerythrin-like domain-containing protein